MDLAINFLDQTILNLQSGQSLRTSLRSSSMPELFICLSKGDQSIQGSPLVQRIYAEIIQIDRSQAKVCDRMKALRRQIYTEKSFRQKSNQILFQTRAQAVVVLLLYIFFLLFLIQQNLFRIKPGVFAMSLLMLAAGLFWIFIVGRKMKWKT